MAIISKVGRKSIKARLLYLVMYMVLIFGAATMIYPFLIMIAGSTKSTVDLKEFDAVPDFIFDDNILYRKHIEGLFNERLDAMGSAYDHDASSFEKILPPENPNAELVEEWKTFLNKSALSKNYFAIGYVETPIAKTMPHQLRKIKQELKKRYGKDINAVNKALQTEWTGWSSVFILPDNFLERRSQITESPYDRFISDVKLQEPLHNRYYFSVEGFYKKQFLKTKYTKDIAVYNAEHSTDYKSYDEIRLLQTVPQNNNFEREDWLEFARSTLNLIWIRADDSALIDYQNYLKAKYHSIDGFNKLYLTSIDTFESIKLPLGVPKSSIGQSDWESFVAGWKDPETNQIYQLAAEKLRVHSVDFLFRDYLKEKYVTLKAANQKLNTTHASFLGFRIPQQDLHYFEFLKMKSSLRWEFCIRNYITTFEYMLLHGRGILNTVIYCSLAVLLALIVNPLAAYALSRYGLPSTYKILLFLMLTMTFPPMVTQIPIFLMLRNFNMLNTFAALVLPGMASGYMIFLLKGFFDSLPRELYESAQIDGAGEWTIFWGITMTLSKPILAVIALQAFTAAYSNFMFALLLCQDECMWTIMVWLYELQMKSGQAVMYASLIIAAIPTFVIFVFCQNIIMRGIVVPVEK